MGGSCDSGTGCVLVGVRIMFIYICTMFMYFCQINKFLPSTLDSRVDKPNASLSTAN